MIRFRMYFNKDKETGWLNEMAERGYAMTAFFANFYTFEECAPGEYIYQIDFNQEFGHVHSAYREFMRETDVEIVCVWGFWIFLRKKAADGPFELYSDVESTIVHYERIQRAFKRFRRLELICLLIEICCGLFRVRIAWAGACLILFIVIGMETEISRLGKMLAELKSRQGEPLPEKPAARPFFWILLIGVTIGILINNVLIQHPIYEFWKHGRILIGLLLIGGGVALALRRE